MNVDLNMLNKKIIYFWLEFHQKNLNMARTNLKDEKLAKKKWFLKRLKLAQGGQKPS
jgi:hypothetical protein